MRRIVVAIIAVPTTVRHSLTSALGDIVLEKEERSGGAPCVEFLLRSSHSQLLALAIS